MKFIDCPLLGKRALNEFVYGGSVKAEPDHDSVMQKEWSEHIFYRHSHPQIQKEWWYHRPTGMWFFFERDTLTDVIHHVSPATKGYANEA
ncbi:MAG: sarcosine oxidase subunit delta [Hydrogenovibrio crunogenus]|uniref:Sarcosine oxidase subunit D n=1 Tax=Hydrogenovibrio crunogenus (strain DSM 25203 / XCL-2) TaxID=317025 RepID=Q31FX8_HYDCU|nr:sarcosine oxidase subunit delta [Hydrogenovibrio crunogenus]